MKAKRSGGGAYNKHLVSCSLFVDYIFLDRDERRYMAQNAHQYLIEQVQTTGIQSTAVADTQINLEFNHPCKEIFLTSQQEYFRDCCRQFETCEPLFKALGIQPFNYTDCLDAIPPAFHAFAAPTNPNSSHLGASSEMGERKLWNSLFRNPGAGYWTGLPGGWDKEIYADGWRNMAVDASSSYAPLGGQGQQSTVSDAGSVVLAETALNMHCWGKNPIYKMVLQLNGQDRFSERSGAWFDLIQPFKYHTHIPDSGINLYSFALKPESHNPSGTLNFSRIDNATLRLTLSNYMFNEHNRAVDLNVYATNYNVLRIMSGMGGLAYSN